MMDGLWEKAQQIIPGGVHSPVRAFKGVGGAPVFIQRAEGTYLYDVEGKKYLDCCMSWGALILGHQHPIVKEEVIKAIHKGWTYGATEPYSLKLAEWMTKEIPFLDKVRFVCSGTEAVMSALRLARGFTRRNKILKFENCYHGHPDSMLVQAGSGLLECSTPSSAGISPATAAETLVAPLGDSAAFEKIMNQFGPEIAAVIIEPLPANNGLIPLDNSFLQLLRDECTSHESLLIFDEVISGFRVSLGGMAELTQITPDLVTYGKVMGGGMPMAAYGGRADIMSLLAPTGSVYQAGTLAGNPVACVAGLTTLEILKSENIIKKLEFWGEKLEKAFENHRHKIIRRGSLFWFPMDKESYCHFFHHALSRHVYLAPSAFEIGFLNAQMSDDALEILIQTIKQGSLTH